MAVFGGNIEDFQFLENPKNKEILLKIPVLDGDISSVAIRLGPNIVRMGFKCGKYWDIKNVEPQVMEKIKERKTVLVGEANEHGVQRAYDAILME